MFAPLPTNRIKTYEKHVVAGCIDLEVLELRKTGAQVQRFLQSQQREGRRSEDGDFSRRLEALEAEVGQGTTLSRNRSRIDTAFHAIQRQSLQPRVQIEERLDLGQTQITLGFPRRIGSIDPQHLDPALRDVAQDVVEQVAHVLTILQLQCVQSGEIQVYLQSARLGCERVS